MSSINVDEQKEAAEVILKNYELHLQDPVSYESTMAARQFLLEYIKLGVFFIEWLQKHDDSLADSAVS